MPEEIEIMEKGQKFQSLSKIAETRVKISIPLPSFTLFKKTLPKGLFPPRSKRRAKAFSIFTRIIVGYLLAHFLLVAFVIFEVSSIDWNPPHSLTFQSTIIDFLKIYFSTGNNLFFGEIAFLAFLIFVLLWLRKGVSSKLASMGVPFPFAFFILLILYLTTFLLPLIGSVAYANYQTFRIVDSLGSVEKLRQIGAETSAEEIKSHLGNQKVFPKIIASDEKIVARIVANLSETDSTETFYTAYILPLVSQKQNLESDRMGTDVFYLPTNTLVVSRINKEIFEAISPTLAKIMINTYFTDKHLEFESNFHLVSRQEYVRLREREINELISVLDDYISESRGILATINANIATTKNDISTYEQKVVYSEQQKIEDYNYCKSAVYRGYYYTYRLYSDAYCDSLRAEWDDYMAELEQYLETLRGYLAIYQSQWAEEKEILDTLVWVRDFSEERKKLTPNELGIFKQDENEIYVVLDDSSPEAIADFLSTLAHEYLHSSTFISDERYLDHFFEEGLTEYFARQVVMNSTSIETALGYPALTKIVSKMNSDILELKEIYFSKDQERLEELIDRKYGNGFYEENWVNLFVLSYLSGEETLKIANSIMLKIGGDQLDREDVSSRISEYAN